MEILAKDFQPIFYSVILAGVYDIKKLKLKLRPEEERKYNSPWNIAAEFDIDMSFTAGQIGDMLREYEKDKGTGMDIEVAAEEIWKKFFLLYLKPIINGTGNYYMEAQTRDARRTDVVVDYAGEQFVVEMKIWHGNEYNERGEEQLADYLDHFHLKKGYMVSFNFNKKKEVGVREVSVGDKRLVEAVL